MNWTPFWTLPPKPEVIDFLEPSFSSPATDLCPRDLPGDTSRIHLSSHAHTHIHIHTHTHAHSEPRLRSVCLWLKGEGGHGEKGNWWERKRSEDIIIAGDRKRERMHDATSPVWSAFDCIRLLTRSRQQSARSSCSDICWNKINHTSIRRSQDRRRTQGWQSRHY